MVLEAYETSGGLTACHKTQKSSKLESYQKNVELIREASMRRRNKIKQ